MDYSNEKNGSIDDSIINNTSDSSNNKQNASSEKDITKSKKTKAKFFKRIILLKGLLKFRYLI